MKCKTCGEDMTGDGYKAALHCPSTDASDREPDADPLHCAAREQQREFVRAAGRVLQAFDDGALLCDSATVQGSLAIDALRAAWQFFVPAYLRAVNHADWKLIAESDALLHEAHKVELDLLTAENAALRADAERYRHMRNSAQFRYRNGPGLYWYLPRFGRGGTGEQLDAAIDAAKAKEASNG